MARRLLMEAPSDPRVHHLLGRLALDSGQAKVARGHLERAVSHARENAGLRVDLGRTYLALAEPAAAVQVLCDAVELDAELSSAWAELGHAMMALGQVQEAARCFKKVMELAWRDPESCRALARRFLQESRLGLAIPCLRRLTEVAPQDLDLQRALGRALLAHGDVDDAVAVFRAALRLEPGSAESLSDLGNALSRQGDSQGARDAYRAATHLAPRVVSHRIKLGLNLTRLGRLDDAEQQFRKALDLESRHPDARAGLAAVLERRGRYGEALDLLERGPLSPLGAARLASVCRHLELPSRGLRPLQDQLARDLPPFEEAVLRHALGDVLHDLQDWDGAFEAHAHANRLRAFHFDPDQHHAATRSLVQAFSARAVRELPRARIRTSRAVLILGLPRSGTTLVEQSLAAHPQIQAGGELEILRRIAIDLPERMGTPAPYYGHLASLSRALVDEQATRYLALLEVLSEDARRVTDKMPHNFQHLGLVAALLPEASIIHCVRDLRDVALSLFFQDLGPGLPYAVDLEWIGHFAVAYRRLMDHWQEVLPLAVHTSPYASLVQDLPRGARGLVEATGLEWDARCARPHEVTREVHTASHAQVRRPVYTTSVDRWRRYEAHLEPFMDVLRRAGMDP